MRIGALAIGFACTLVFAASSASALSAHGQLLRLSSLGNTTKSSNWLGYSQGALQRGVKVFHSISADWKVPRATQHRRGQAEYSSDWIGIGGGCVNSGCTIGDQTLIQTGTEQDVSSSGRPSYSAWWEVIPGPAMTIRSMRVGRGDRMHASITELDPQVWKVTIKDLSRRESYSKIVPYSSTQDTAEWIEETPLIFGSNTGFAALPNLTSPGFDWARTNRRPAHLKVSEEIELAGSDGRVIGVPSSPDPDSDGFNACAWARTCLAPRSS